MKVEMTATALRDIIRESYAYGYKQAQGRMAIVAWPTGEGETEVPENVHRVIGTVTAEQHMALGGAIMAAVDPLVDQKLINLPDQFSDDLIDHAEKWVENGLTDKGCPGHTELEEKCCLNCGL